MGEVVGFRIVLKFLLFVSIAFWALVGGLVGASTVAFGVRDPGVAAVFFAIVGGAIGWLIGSFLHGIGYTLLSINDHLAAMRNVSGAGNLDNRQRGGGERQPSVPSPTSQEWRDKLEKLPAGQSIDINGLTVFKIRKPNGEFYFAGEKDFASVDDVMRHYQLE